MTSATSVTKLFLTVRRSCYLLIAVVAVLALTSSKHVFASGTTLLSDNFTGTTIDTTKWTVHDTVGSSVTQNNAALIKNSYTAVKDGNNENWYQTSLDSVDTFPVSGLTVSAQITPGSGSSGSAVLGYGDPNFDATSGTAYLIDLSGANVLGLSWVGGAYNVNANCGSVVSGAIYSIVTVSDGFDIYVNTGGGNTLSCAVTGLSGAAIPDDKQVFMQADTTTNSAFNNLLVTGTATNTVPDAPTGLTATPDNGQVGLSWTAGPNGGSAITDYQVQYKIHTDSSWTTFADGTSTATSATVTGLTNSTSYDFRVAAINTNGMGDYSSTATATPSLPTASTAPQNLLASIGDSQALLTWNAPSSNGGSAITDYLVEYKQSSDSSWTTFADGTSTATSATVTGLTNGTSYDFRVSAVNGISTSVPSSVQTVTPASGQLLSDDFTGTTIDASKWTVTDTSGTSITQNGTLSVKNSYSDPNWDQNSIVSKTTFASSNLSVSANMTEGTGGTPAALLGYGDTNFQGNTSKTYLIDIAGPTVYALAWQNGSTAASNLNCGSTIEGATYALKVTNTGFSVYENNTLLCSLTTFSLTNKPVFMESDATGPGSQYDNILVSNVVINAPGAPTALAATPGNDQVGLTWSAPASNGGASITDYQVEYEVTGSNSWTTFADGTSTATSATVTGLTNGDSYDFRVSAINAEGAGTASGTITSSPNAINAPLTITEPARSVSASPNTATLTIHDEDSHDFTIPYIQTSPNLTVSANIGTNVMPVGDSVKFVLTGTHDNSVSATVSSAPYTTTFNGLAKDDYNLTATVVDSSGVAVSGANFTDHETQLGIGDIISAVGDSITECYFGTERTTTPVTDWTDAPTGTVSSDNRNFPQYGPTTLSNLGAVNWCTPWEHELSQELEDYYDYPVFIMNEGVGGIRADNTVTRMATSQWSDREAALHPDKMLLHLGTNDGIAGISTADFLSSMQSIITTFETTYGVTSNNIWLAKPSYSATYTNTANYLPDIATLRSNNNLIGGPDFYTFYSTNTTNWYSSDPVHPNEAGDLQMARLWAVSMISPKNETATNTGNGIHVSWGDLSTIEPSISDYKVSYGTSPSNLSTTVDVLSGTSTDITTGLTPNTPYYFSVKGYDNSPTPQPTLASDVATATYSVAPSAPTGLTTTPSNGSVALSWTAGSNGGSAITDYQIQYKVHTDSSWTTFADGTSTATSATITGLTNDTSYDFRVTAININGLGTTSSAATATPHITNPSISQIVVTPTDTGATIAWHTDVTSNAQLSYGLTTSYGTTSSLADNVTKTLTHSIALSSLQACTTYQFILNSISSYSDAANSGNQHFTTTGCASNGTVTSATTAVIPDTGGGSTSLTAGSSELAVNVPSGTVGSDADFQIQHLNDTALTSLGAPSDTLTSATDQVYDVKAFDGSGNPVTTFNHPVTITLSYSDAQIADLDESTLVVYHYHNSSWSALSSCVIDAGANTITCQTPNFSLFALYGAALPPQSTPTNTTTDTNATPSATTTTKKKATTTTATDTTTTAPATDDQTTTTDTETQDNPSDDSTAPDATKDLAVTSGNKTQSSSHWLEIVVAVIVVVIVIIVGVKLSRPKKVTF